MELARTEDDHCPHCVDRFEIVCVKFRFARYPTMVVVCPSCAYTANWGIHRARALWRKSSMIRALNARFGYIVALLTGAGLCL